MDHPGVANFWLVFLLVVVVLVVVVLVAVAVVEVVVVVVVLVVVVVVFGLRSFWELLVLFLKTSLDLLFLAFLRDYHVFLFFGTNPG